VSPGGRGYILLHRYTRYIAPHGMTRDLRLVFHRHFILPIPGVNQVVP
jgi:hypothetical protein